MKTCKFPDCGRKCHAKGWCGAHYAQILNGRPLTPVRAVKPSAYPRRPNNGATERDEQGRKMCVRCREWLDETSFCVTRSNPDGLARDCRTCNTAQARKGALKRRYGLTVEAYQRLLDEQGGACAICRTPDPGGRAWDVDHDHTCCPGTHTCGRCIRGLLCPPCNRGMGTLGDDPRRLMAAAVYLIAGREAVLKGLGL